MEPTGDITTLVFIIDGNVEMVLNTDNRSAALLLSNPLILDATGTSEALLNGAKYDQETRLFTPRNAELEPFTLKEPTSAN